MTTRHFKVVLEWDAASRMWVSLVPGLADLSTFAATREEAVAQTREAILGYLEAAAKEGIAIPEEDIPVEIVDIEVAVA